jgi:molecular chaperone GrpE
MILTACTQCRSKRETVTDKKRTTEEAERPSSYTVDMSDLEGIGDLSDLDIESFMMTEDSEAGNTPESETTNNSPGLSSPISEDPFAGIDAAPELEGESATTDRVVPNKKKTTAGSPEHAAMLQEQLARLAADFDNFRKRSKREADEAVKFANEGILRALLPIIDNLERALESGGDPKATISGVKMVSKQFSQDLRRFGLKGFDATGDKFDPKSHEAFEMIPTADTEPGTVVKVYQRGFYMHERLLRPAMVAVSKAMPPKAEEKVEEALEAPEAPEPPQAEEAQAPEEEAAE